MPEGWEMKCIRTMKMEFDRKGLWKSSSMLKSNEGK